MSEANPSILGVAAIEVVMGRSKQYPWKNNGIDSTVTLPKGPVASLVSRFLSESVAEAFEGMGQPPTDDSIPPPAKFAVNTGGPIEVTISNDTLEAIRGRMRGLGFDTSPRNRN